VNPVLSLRNVSKGYFGHAKVLEGINLQLARGDFLYVVGGSGAGKSSFLRMLATEELPSSGHVSLFGYDLGRMSPSVLQTIRRTIAVIPQDVRLIPDLTVEENVALSLELSIKRPTQAEIRRRVSELLGQLGLSSKRMSLARDISGGEA
jgi:cell division transport system ATP-binding protein